MINVRHIAMILTSIIFSQGPATSMAAGDVFLGEVIYSTHCIRCHIHDGSGMDRNTPNFKLGQGLFQADEILIETLKYGKGVMPSYFGILSDDDLSNVMAYTRTLQ